MADKKIIKDPASWSHRLKETKEYSDQKMLKKDQSKNNVRNFSALINGRIDRRLETRATRETTYKNEKTIWLKKLEVIISPASVTRSWKGMEVPKNRKKRYRNREAFARKGQGQALSTDSLPWDSGMVIEDFCSFINVLPVSLVVPTGCCHQSADIRGQFQQPPCARSLEREDD
jgi:hypothetical protein